MSRGRRGNKTYKISGVIKKSGYSPKESNTSLPYSLSQVLVPISRTSAGTQEIQNSNFNFQDPGTWPSKISDSQRCFFFVTKITAKYPHDPDLSRSLQNGRISEE